MSTTTAAANRRNSQRVEGNCTASAVIGGFAYTCVVADMSATGAKLRFDHPVFVRGSLQLCIGDTLWDACQVVWRNGCEVGIAFP
jgi:hypothetical protein